MSRVRSFVIVPAAFLLAVALVVAACSPSAPRLTDPNEILDKAVAGVAATKTVHVTANANGTVNGAALSLLAPMLGMGGDTGSLGGLTGGTTKIDNTSLKGDLDVEHQAFHVTFSVPALFFLSGDVIGVDNDLYYKTTLGGSKYTKVAGEALPLPTPGASASLDLPSMSAQLKQSLKDAGVTFTLKGIESVAGKDAYHLTAPLPDTSKIGAAASAGIPSLGTGTIDLWVYVDGTRPAQVEVKTASPSLGNVDLTVTFTDYDKSVSIQAPAPSDIQGS